MSSVTSNLPSHGGPVHLVGHFDDPFAGAERSLLELGQALQGQREVCLWSDVTPHPFFATQGVRAISAFGGDFPKGGMLVFGGVHVRPGVWLAHANPDRLALKYNLPNHGALFAMIEQLRDASGLDPELLFVSSALQMSVDLPGRVDPPLIQLTPYLDLSLCRPAGRPFIVGRVSRDVVEKHHAHDPALYRMLAAMGLRVRVMGGTCLRDQIGDVPGIELLPAGAETVPHFFASLDAMFYRTGTVYEAYGRVIFEAMASGLPVVASGFGGYAQMVLGDHGVNLVDSQEQALDALRALAASVELRQRGGRRARARAVVLHGEVAARKQLETYLT